VTDYLERALALADETAGIAYPKPDVGAVVVPWCAQGSIVT